MTAISNGGQAAEPLRVVVVGGGIAGLSAAWYIIKEARGKGVAVRCTLLEQSDRWGGKILSETVTDGQGGVYVVEGGPDSFISQKPSATQLAAEVGVGDLIIGTNDARRKTYVVSRGRPVPLPDGVLLIVPTKFLPFALSPLISPLGKLRMGLELVIPAKRDSADETLAAFVRRRLGSEALDKIAEPLLSGIYNAEADRQSLLATFPRFRALEEQYGSLTKGILQGRRNGGQAGHKSNDTGPQGHAQPAAAAPAAMFLSLKGGCADLVDATVRALTSIAELRLRCEVTGVDRAGAGYAVRLASGEVLPADAVVLAAPSFTAAPWVRPHAPAAAEIMDGIRYVSTGTVSLAYRAEDMAAVRTRGFGVVVPRSEKRPINAITFSSVKFDHRAPAGSVLLRVFIGGSRSPQSMQLDDPALLTAVKGELAQLLGLKAEPLFHRIYRWPRCNPQYDVGHLERMSELEAALPAGLYVTGSPYRGVGLPDCVKQSHDLAQTIVAGLATA